MLTYVSVFGCICVSVSAKFQNYEHFDIKVILQVEARQKNNITFKPCQGCLSCLYNILINGPLMGFSGMKSKLRRNR